MAIALGRSFGLWRFCSAVLVVLQLALCAAQDGNATAPEQVREVRTVYVPANGTEGGGVDANQVFANAGGAAMGMLLMGVGGGALWKLRQGAADAQKAKDDLAKQLPKRKAAFDKTQKKWQAKLAELAEKKKKLTAKQATEHARLEVEAAEIIASLEAAEVNGTPLSAPEVERVRKIFPSAASAILSAESTPADRIEAAEDAAELKKMRVDRKLKDESAAVDAEWKAAREGMAEEIGDHHDEMAELASDLPAPLGSTLAAQTRTLKEQAQQAILGAPVGASPNLSNPADALMSMAGGGGGATSMLSSMMPNAGGAAAGAAGGAAGGGMLAMMMNRGKGQGAPAPEGGGMLASMMGGGAPPPQQGGGGGGGMLASMMGGGAPPPQQGGGGGGGMLASMMGGGAPPPPQQGGGGGGMLASMMGGGAPPPPQQGGGGGGMLASMMGGGAPPPPQQGGGGGGMLASMMGGSAAGSGPMAGMPPPHPASMMMDHAGDSMAGMPAPDPEGMLGGMPPYDPEVGVGAPPFPPPAGNQVAPDPGASLSAPADPAFAPTVFKKKKKKAKPPGDSPAMYAEP